MSSRSKVPVDRARACARPNGTGRRVGIGRVGRVREARAEDRLCCEGNFVVISKVHAHFADSDRAIHTRVARVGEVQTPVAMAATLSTDARPSLVVSEGAGAAHAEGVRGGPGGVVVAVLHLDLHVLAAGGGVLDFGTGDGLPISGGGVAEDVGSA